MLHDFEEVCADVVDMILCAQIARLEQENKFLRSLINSFADRIAAQSEILSRGIEIVYHEIPAVVRAATDKNLKKP